MSRFDCCSVACTDWKAWKNSPILVYTKLTLWHPMFMAASYVRGSLWDIYILGAQKPFEWPEWDCPMCSIFMQELILCLHPCVLSSPWRYFPWVSSKEVGTHVLYLSLSHPPESVQSPSSREWVLVGVVDSSQLGTPKRTKDLEKLKQMEVDHGVTIVTDHMQWLSGHWMDVGTIRIIAVSCPVYKKLHSGTMCCSMTVASYPGLLTPVFVTCSTNAVEGLVKLITCNDYLDVGWTCGGAPHSQNNRECTIDRKHRPWSDWVLDTRQSWWCFLGSESHFIAVQEESATPPHVHPAPRCVIACDQFYQAFPCISAASNKMLGWGGLDMRLQLCHIPLSSCLYSGYESSYNSDGTYKHLGFTTPLSCPEYL